jgi:hypothetical protein
MSEAHGAGARWIEPRARRPRPAVLLDAVPSWRRPRSTPPWRSRFSAALRVHSIWARTINRIEISGLVHVAPKKRHGHVSQDVWEKIIGALARHGVELVPENVTPARSSLTDSWSVPLWKSRTSSETS